MSNGFNADCGSLMILGRRMMGDAPTLNVASMFAYGPEGDMRFASSERGRQLRRPYFMGKTPPA
jgi:hypothetical protein